MRNVFRTVLLTTSLVGVAHSTKLHIYNTREYRNGEYFEVENLYDNFVNWRVVKELIQEKKGYAIDRQTLYLQGSPDELNDEDSPSWSAGIEIPKLYLKLEPWTPSTKEAVVAAEFVALAAYGATKVPWPRLLRSAQKLVHPEEKKGLQTKDSSVRKVPADDENWRIVWMVVGIVVMVISAASAAIGIVAFVRQRGHVNSRVVMV